MGEKELLTARFDDSMAILRGKVMIDPWILGLPILKQHQVKIPSTPGVNRE